MVLINTARLVMRPLTMNDLDALVDLHADPRVNRFVPAFSREQMVERLADIEQQWLERGHGLCAVELRDGRAFIGRCGLKYWAQFDEVEAGWILKPGAWGHGYATEAAGACVEWGFARLGVDYFTAMINPANTASVGVAKRLGFTPRRDDVLLGKKVVVYALDRPA
jgi:RimJ/RimL family protein N-acetyltransferase